MACTSATTRSAGDVSGIGSIGSAAIAWAANASAPVCRSQDGHIGITVRRERRAVGRIRRYRSRMIASLSVAKPETTASDEQRERGSRPLLLAYHAEAALSRIVGAASAATILPK